MRNAAAAVQAKIMNELYAGVTVRPNIVSGNKPPIANTVWPMASFTATPEKNLANSFLFMEYPF